MHTFLLPTPTMATPTLDKAEALLAAAAEKNPGFGWVEHSRYVADAAGRLAASHPGLDEATARVFGLLHDIGRREGGGHNRHIIDGYTYLMSLGYSSAARICLTHSFPVRNVDYCVGIWDTTPEEFAFLRQAISDMEYDEYDRLIQLCDAMAISTGFVLLEKRMVDVGLRHGLNDTSIARWQALFALKAHFDTAVGCSVYELLPGIVENTFGR